VCTTVGEYLHSLLAGKRPRDGSDCAVQTEQAVADRVLRRTSRDTDKVIIRVQQELCIIKVLACVI
jgi:hypothetical protein